MDRLPNEECQRCKGQRIAAVSAKVSDRCTVSMGERSYTGYAPDDMGIGDDDYLDFAVCLDCGQMQGVWPVDATKFEKEIGPCSNT